MHSKDGRDSSRKQTAIPSSLLQQRNPHRASRNDPGRREEEAIHIPSRRGRSSTSQTMVLSTYGLRQMDTATVSEGRCEDTEMLSLPGNDLLTLSRSCPRLPKMLQGSWPGAGTGGGTESPLATMPQLSRYRVEAEWVQPYEMYMRCRILVSEA